MNQRPQLEGANAVRFWAAMSIVLFHVALLPKKDLPAFLWVIPSFGGFGGFGAPLFYVLSAFALSYGYYGSLETGAAIRRFYTGCRKADGTGSGGSTSFMPSTATLPQSQKNLRLQKRAKLR